MARLRCARARHAAGCDKVIIGIDAPSVILILIWIGQTDCCCAQAQPATGGPSRSGPSPGPTPPGALPSVALCGPQLQTSGLRVRKKPRFRSLASHRLSLLRRSPTRSTEHPRQGQAFQLLLSSLSPRSLS